MRAIITRGLYIFYPIFHCSLYCRAVYNAEQLMFHIFLSYLYKDATKNRIDTTFLLYILHTCITAVTAAYTAEWCVLQEKFFEPQNPRFIIESGFKPRAGYSGARTVMK